MTPTSYYNQVGNVVLKTLVKRPEILDALKALK